MLQKIFAQNTGVPTTIDNPLPAEFGTLAAIFGFMFNVVIGVGIALVVIFLGIAGIKYVTSQGDPKAVEAAQKALTNAVIGLVIVLAAITIRFVIQNLLGANVTGLNNVAI